MNERSRPIRYDTMEEFNVDSKAECGQLILTHETKTNKRQCPLSSVQVQYLWRLSGRNKSDYGGKDLWKKWVLSLEWKTEEVIDSESEGGVQHVLTYFVMTETMFLCIYFFYCTFFFLSHMGFAWNKRDCCIVVETYETTVVLREFCVVGWAYFNVGFHPE